MLHKKQADLRRRAEKVLREQAEESGKLAAEDVQNLIMDIMMPLMDSPACIHALRKINPRVRIIGVSGLTEKGKLEKNASEDDTRGYKHGIIF